MNRISWDQSPLNCLFERSPKDGVRMADTYGRESLPQQPSVGSLNCSRGELIESNSADKRTKASDIEFVVFKGSRTHTRFSDVLQPLLQVGRNRLI